MAKQFASFAAAFVAMTVVGAIGVWYGVNQGAIGLAIVFALLLVGSVVFVVLHSRKAIYYWRHPEKSSTEPNSTRDSTD